MKISLFARLLPSLLALGLGANPAAAQYPPAGAPAPNTAPLRSEPLVLDERELEEAVREGQGLGQPRTEWAIAPAPVAAPAPSLTPPLKAAPVISATPFPSTAQVPSAAPSAPQSAAPAVASIPYLSGGIGYDERERMEAVKSQYNLRLLFAVSGSGNYLSSVKVRIQDGRGASLIDITSNGPWFFAQVPPGAYVLTLDNEGQIQQRNLHIGPQGAVVENIYWAGPVASYDAGQASGPGGGYPPPAASPSYPPLPPLTTSTGIPYLSGGEDPAELARMEAASDDYNLRLNFKIATAKPQTSPIRVRVLYEGTDRPLFEAEAKGPLFLARIPPGRYLVRLKYQGRDYEQKVSVPGYGSATASFEWTD